MALEDIKKKIISDAEAEAQEIKSQTEKKISDLNKSAELEIEQTKLKILDSAKNKAQEKFKSALVDQKIKNSNKLLEAKRQIIDNIIDETLSDLEKISDSDYKILLNRQINKIQSIKLDSIKVLCAKNKSSLIKSIFEENKLSAQAIFEETDKVQGGFMIKTTDSIIDLSFANMIEENKHTLEAEINKLVFKN